MGNATGLAIGVHKKAGFIFETELHLTFLRASDFRLPNSPSFTLFSTCIPSHCFTQFHILIMAPHCHQKNCACKGFNAKGGSLKSWDGSCVCQHTAKWHFSDDEEPPDEESKPSKDPEVEAILNHY